MEVRYVSRSTPIPVDSVQSHNFHHIVDQTLKVLISSEFPKPRWRFPKSWGYPHSSKSIEKVYFNEKTFFQPKFWPSMEPQQNPQSFRATPCPWDVLGWAASGCAASDQPTHHGRGSGECGATGQGSEWESAGSTFCKIAQVSMIILWKIPTSWNLCGLYSWLNQVIISYIYIYIWIISANGTSQYFTLTHFDWRIPQRLGLSK